MKNYFMLLRICFFLYRGLEGWALDLFWISSAPHLPSLPQRDVQRLFPLVFIKERSEGLHNVSNTLNHILTPLSGPNSNRNSMCLFFFYLPYLKLNFLSIEFYRSDFKINPCQKTKKDMLSSSDSIQVLLGREQRFLLKKKSSPTHWKMWAHRGCEWHVSPEYRLGKGMLIPLQSIPTHVKCRITASLSGHKWTTSCKVT